MKSIPIIEEWNMWYVVKISDNLAIFPFSSYIKVREMILLLSFLLHQSKGNDFASANPQ